MQSSYSFIVVQDSRTRTILAKIDARQALTFIPSPDGSDNYILVVTWEKYLVVWDHHRGSRVAVLEIPSDVEEDKPGSWKADVSKNFLFAWLDDGTLLVWETQSFALVHTYHHRLPEISKGTPSSYNNFIHVSLDERWLLAHNNSGWADEITVWDTATWTLLAILPRHEDHDAHYRVSVAFTEGETSIIAACRCGAIQKCDFRTGRLLHNLSLIDSDGSTVHLCARSTTQQSPNSHRVCWKPQSSDNPIVKMSDTDTGALLWSFGITSPYLGHIAEIFFSHDGRYVAVEYSDKVLRVLRVEDGECVASESTGGDTCGLHRFSRNGKALVLVMEEDDLTAFRYIEL